MLCCDVELWLSCLCFFQNQPLSLQNIASQLFEILIEFGEIMSWHPTYFPGTQCDADDIAQSLHLTISLLVSFHLNIQW